MNQTAFKQEGPLTFLAHADLEAYRRVKIHAGTATIPPEVEYAGAGEACIGVTARWAEAGDAVSVVPLTDVASLPLCASKSFASGAALYGAADGKVSDAAEGKEQFVSLMAASGDGHVISAIVNLFA